MNKRAQILGETIPWMLRLIVTFVLFTLLLAQIWMVVNQSIQTDQADIDAYVARLVYGPHGLFIKDNAGRIVEGVIDISTMRPPWRDYQVYFEQAGEQRFGARIRLYQDADDIGTDKLFSGSQVYVHQPDIVKKKLNIGKAGLIGQGSAAYTRHILPVQVIIGNKLQPGWLDIEAVKVKK